MSNVRLPIAAPPGDPAPPDTNPGAALPAIGELIGDDDREPLFQEAMTALHQALTENDVNKARIATMLVQAIRKAGKQDDGVKIKTDERFVDSVALMVKSEFAIPSQLAEFEEALVEPSDS